MRLLFKEQKKIVGSSPTMTKLPQKKRERVKFGGNRRTCRVSNRAKRVLKLAAKLRKIAKRLFLAGLSAGGCDVGNPLVGIGLAQALFEDLRGAFNQSLGFAKSEVCKSLNGLDNANLLGGVE